MPKKSGFCYNFRCGTRDGGSEIKEQGIKEQRTKSKEQRAKSKEQRAKNKEQKLGA